MNRWNCYFAVARRAAPRRSCLASDRSTSPRPPTTTTRTPRRSSRTTGPPIFLDEPESPPPASLVEKRVDSDKYRRRQAPLRARDRPLLGQPFRRRRLLPRVLSQRREVRRRPIQERPAGRHLDLLARQRQGKPHSHLQERPARRQLGSSQRRGRGRRQAQLQGRQTRRHLGRLRRDRQATPARRSNTPTAKPTAPGKSGSPPAR